MTRVSGHSPEDDFQKAYKAFSGAVFHFCLARISDYEQAMDLTQETFLRLWKILYENKPVKNSRAFLFTCARNLITDVYRKKKAVSLEGLLVEDAEDKSMLLAHESDVETKFEADNLVQKINTLNPIYRDAIYMRLVQGLKLNEIAKLMGKSVNVISVRISRGLRLLRQTLHYEE